MVFDNPAALAAFTRDIPLRRGGEPQEIGGAVVFLASGAGAYVTGVTLPVDGGVVGLPPSPGVAQPDVRRDARHELTRNAVSRSGALSVEVATPVHDNDLAGDASRSVRGEKQHGFGDVSLGRHASRRIHRVL